MLFAGDRLIVNQGQVLALLQRSVQGCNGDHSAGGIQTGGWPSIEGEADSILILDFFKVHGVILVIGSEVGMGLDDEQSVLCRGEEGFAEGR